MLRTRAMNTKKNLFKAKNAVLFRRNVYLLKQNWIERIIAVQKRVKQKFP